MHRTRTPERIIAFVVCLILVSTAWAQIPTKCLEIERMLVDACNSACPGAQEGENEMFRFKVGPSPITLSDLEASWTTQNTFLGWIQNATTASLTAQLNNTITNCGWLREPLNGELPPGASVLGITSTNMCLAGNSFAGLSDTLFVIFQSPGNTFGHFKNNTNGNTATTYPTGNSDPRLFRLTVISEQCVDSATYDCRSLVNQIGGYGGGPGLNDGSSVQVSWPGPPQVSYVNDGCQAPFTPLSVQITTQQTTVPCGGDIVLTAATSGNIASLFWTGGTGNFSTVSASTTTYSLGIDEVANTSLLCCVVSACGDTLCDSIDLEVTGGVTVAIVPEGPITLCPGTTIELTAVGGPNFAWSTGAVGTTINVGSAGTYTVTASNACGTANASAEVVDGALPSANITGPESLCDDTTAELVATGGEAFLWSTGATGPVLTIDGPGAYSVTASNGCGSDLYSFTVVPGASVDLGFTHTDPQGCAPHCMEFVATATDATFLWVFGDGTTATGSPLSSCFRSGIFDVSLTVLPSDYSTLCPGDTTVNDLVRSWPTPVAHIATEPAIASMDAPEVWFTSVGSGVETASWSIGTEPVHDTTSMGFLHRFTAAGCYPLALTVSNSFGCIDEVSDLYCVEETFALWIPNAFTPNNDGVNDVFRIVTSLQGAMEGELAVFDRWGSLIHSTALVTEGWDGADTMDGVYVWKLRLKDRQGKWHDRMGHVVLIR